MTVERKCECGCGATLVRRKTEGLPQFSSRRFHSRACWELVRGRAGGRAIEIVDWEALASRSGGSVPDYRPHNISLK